MPSFRLRAPVLHSFADVLLNLDQIAGWLDGVTRLVTTLANLKIVVGGVTSAGAVAFGTGFTPSQVATGRYELAFTGFTATPVVIAFPYGNLTGTGGDWGAGIDEQTTYDNTQAGIAVESAGALTDNKFVFVAVGAA